MKRLYLLAVAIVMASGVYAQWRVSPFVRPQRYHFQAGLRGGTGAWMIDSKMGFPTQLGDMEAIDLGYTYLTTRYFGYHIGLSVSRLSSGCQFNSATRTAMGYIKVSDNQSHSIRPSHFTIETKDISEVYSGWYVEVPLQIELQADHWWCRMGIKGMLPITMQAHYSTGETTVGVGHQIDGTGSHIANPVETFRYDAEEGDYEVTDIAGGKVCHPLYVSLALEGGYRWALAPSQMLYVGVWIDCALNRTACGGSDDVMEFNGTRPQFWHILESSRLSHLRYAAAGIKVSYDMAWGKKVDSFRGKAIGSRGKPRRYRR